MKDFNVDLVYLWCDGSDPEFKKKKDLWREKKGSSESSEATSSARFVQIDELKYSLRSVEKYIPWINHIYVITSNQTPKWLNTKNPKITIIDDSQLVPKRFLPVFNSNAIEAALHKIPNLSEHFLYACDDMFVNRPLKKSFFFQDEKTPIIRVKNNYLNPCTLYAEQLAYAVSLMKRDFGKDIPFFAENRIEPHHNIDAYLKSDYKDCVQHFKKEYTETLKHRFRKASSIQRYIVSIWSFIHHRGLVKTIPICNKETDKKPFKIDSLYMSNRYKEDRLNRLSIYNPGLFCINDGELSGPEDRIRAKQFLDKCFPKKSKFET